MRPLGLGNAAAVLDVQLRDLQKLSRFHKASLEPMFHGGSVWSADMGRLIHKKNI